MVSTGSGDDGVDDVGDIVVVEGSDAGEGRNVSFPAQVGACADALIGVSVVCSACSSSGSRDE